ncbi:hypothetical protein H4R24_005361 [Coemansia sp. RSA 988]|nr:hypothetical protein H4R24_005361 [Coemansia sp. RSA 988]
MGGRADTAADEATSAKAQHSDDSNNSRDCDAGCAAIPRSPLVPTADLQGTPTTTRRAGGSNGGGLGLHPPNTFSPENASMYSSQSGIDSASSGSKPPSQKSSSMSLVRRLRRLSSAALHGKVNRLFSRPSNTSQDSLASGAPMSPSAPSSPSPAHSHAFPVRPLSGIAIPGHATPPASSTGEWRASNAPNLPPLPPKPLSSRRSRALTEITPLAVRGRMEPATEVSSGNETQPPCRAVPPGTKNINAPPMASPLLRKSFHTLSNASSRDDMHAFGRSPKGVSKQPSSTNLIPTTPANKAARNKSPKLIRSSSHTPHSNDGHVFSLRSNVSQESTGGSYAPNASHKLSYQLASNHTSSQAYQAAQTPSPPDRTTGRSQTRIDAGSGTPTMQRRRTALATLRWPSGNGKDQEGNSLSSPPPPPPSLPKRSSAARAKQPSVNEVRANYPSDLLSTHQLRSRMGPELHHQTGTATDSSARSSTSMISDSAHSWVLTTSDTDKVDGVNVDKGTLRDNALSLAALEGRHDIISRGASALEPASDHPSTDVATPQSQKWLSATKRLQWLFYPSIPNWQLPPDGPATLQDSSPSPSSVNDLTGAPGNMQRQHSSSSECPAMPHTSSQELQTGLATATEGVVRRHAQENAELGTALATPSSGSITNMQSCPIPPPSVPISQAVRPRGGSQPMHLARAATANAIRLKEKSAVRSVDTNNSVSRRASAAHMSPGSAPELFNIDVAIGKNRTPVRMRATSATIQQVPLTDETSGGTEATSPTSSCAGDYSRTLPSHAWPPSSLLRDSPERVGEVHLSAGMHTPSSTSSPPAHSHTHHNSQSGHHLRLNVSSVQRSASGHSVSSGISELLEPSSVSIARRDALWQVLVVSKSRADTEIDKILRQWKEADGGAIICAQDADLRLGGDDDAIILKVKRGHRRSTSDMKRADSGSNEFRRRVIDLACLIRASSVSELSNDGLTSGITEQLYGLLTEQRTRFPADANIGALILDVLYQFSAVSQTVSQLGMSLGVPAAPRGISGDASPAVSQFPSPQLAPELALARGVAGALPPLASTLASRGGGSGGHVVSRSLGQRDTEDSTGLMYGEFVDTPQSSIGRARSVNSTTISDIVGELNDYSIGRTASNGSQLHRAAYAGTDMRARPPDSLSYVSSPRLMPTTEHSSTTSLPSLLASIHGSAGYAFGASAGRLGTTGNSTPTSMHQLPNVYQRQRFYLPVPAASQPGRASADVPDAETDVSSRPSLDDANLRPSLDRQPSQLSISSDIAESSAPSRKKIARASLQAQSLYPSLDKSREATGSTTPKSILRPATMYIPKSGFSWARRVSDSTTRQERLAHLLSEDSEFSDSTPTSPVNTPSRPGFDAREDSLTPKHHTQGLVTIPEAKHSSDTLALSRDISALTRQTASVPTPSAGPILDRRMLSEKDSEVSRRSIVLEERDEPDSDHVLPADGSFRAGSVEAADYSSGRSHSDTGLDDAASYKPAVDTSKSTDSRLVVCRICERSFFRSELNAHSDVCILEQTRAMKLDEVNQRMRRLRDAVSKRLTDLRKARQWDKAAARESERIIRIADRAIFWPEGDGQQDLIVAKAKFAKYIEKLFEITGTKSTVQHNTEKSSSRLPRADIETLWLARQLLARVQEKCEIIEEFDKEFGRLERQEALMREVESADAEAAADSALMSLPTWAQLAHSGYRSPIASERTSMELTHSHSESGSATPDVAAPSLLGSGSKAVGPLPHRSSRASRVGRRSLSRPSRLGSDTAEGESHSGSRKLVSLFAALFRNNQGGLGRSGKDGSMFRRRSSPSPFAHGSLPASSRSSSVLNRAPLNVPTQAPSTPTTAQSSTSASNSGSNANISVLADAPVDLPLSSPGTRQRNNSQLSAMRGTPESAAKVQRMPSIEDFDFVKPISRGAFGRVYLTRKKATKDLYAIKVMRKKDMINKNMVTQALAERRALSLLSTDWVVQLYYAFHSSKHLFLVMEYLVGGDLAGLLRVWGVMDESAACFYIGEIACAIDYLHRNSIVHRDIKPDNVILASDGHIKLTDFGLSQVAVRGSTDGKAHDGSESNATLDSPMSDSTPLSDTEMRGGASEKTDDYWAAALALSGRGVTTPPPAASNAQALKMLPVSKRAHARKSTRGFLGTPDYLAPELLLGAGNGLAVDWWALGVCLFEFVCGYPPFTDESPEAIFRNILNHAIDWPDEEDYVSSEAAELISALLRPEPATRAHWKDILVAKLFTGWDLNNIRQREPPFVPRPDDDVDTSYFETSQRKELQRLSNATFLQVASEVQQQQVPHPLFGPSAQAIAGASLSDADKNIRRSSQKGSRRGSRRQRSASGSVTASVGNRGSGSRPSIGQLKRLFNDMAVTEDTGAQVEKASLSSNAVDGQCETQVSSPASSSDSFLMEDRSIESGSMRRRATESTPNTRYSVVGSNKRTVGENGSINSLSDSDLEQSPQPTQAQPEHVPSSAGETASIAQIVATLPLPTSPVVNPAQRTICRSPSQCSDGAFGSALPPALIKTHSRCASVSTVPNAKKKNAAAPKSRRPSDGGRSLVELDATAGPLVRSSSTDDRLQNTGCAANTTLGHGDIESGADGTGAEDDANQDGDAGDDDGDADDDAERAFEDFTYKNLALLNNVNRGMSSSSGSASPMPERPPPGPAAATAAGSILVAASAEGGRTPAHGSGSGSGPMRESPVNAYDAT